MNNVRYNISPCSPSEVGAFIEKIDKSLYVPRGEVKADTTSHYDRYSYLRDELKVAVVYDTVASCVSITAPSDFADELLNVFGAGDKLVKRSTVPAQGSVRRDRREPVPITSVTVGGSTVDTRARLFVTPIELSRRPQSRPTTVIVNSKGQELSTDENFPPDERRRTNTRPANSQRGSVRVGFASDNVSPVRNAQKKAPSVEAYFAKQNGQNGKTAQTAQTAQNDGKRAVGRPRKMTISFATEEDYSDSKPLRPQRSGTGLYADIAQAQARSGEENRTPATSAPAQQNDLPEKRRRGRPRKLQAQADIVQPPALRDEPPQKQLEYKNGYSVKNVPAEKLAAIFDRLEGNGSGISVVLDEKEFAGTPQEIETYLISGGTDRVILRYATNKMTVQLQGKPSEPFTRLQAELADSSSETAAPAKTKEQIAVEKRLLKLLPTAYEFLSEQSRTEFMRGIKDFSQRNVLSDYSVLLVPPYRGLERFIFDLQRAEGIAVKMIGQAYDKDDSGNYILKNGYRARINSVVYCEVMVALYTEYFSHRNFITHSDNTDESCSRGITDSAEAEGVFKSLLRTVEYNAKKLKEIGFTMDGGTKK